MINIPEELYPIVGISPATTNGGVVSDYISMKNILSVSIQVALTQAVGHATALSLTQAQDVSGTGAKALVLTVPIWANEDVAASDELERQTDGVAYTVSADIKNKLVTFRVDSQKLDGNNDFDCIALTIADSSQATNLVSVMYECETRYAPEDMPSNITD